MRTPSGITRGTGTLTYTITSGGASGITINSGTGQITVAGTTAIGTYTVNVSVQSDIAGGSTAIEGTISVTVQPIDVGGNLTYTAISTDFGTAANATPSGVTRGTGTLTYTITSGGANGISINSGTGQITVAGTTAVGTYRVNVSVQSDITGGSTPVTGTISVTVRALIPVSGTLNYTANIPGASGIRVGNSTAVTIANAGTINNATSYTIVPATAGTDIGGVSINQNNGAISIANAQRVGTARYTVTANGATSDTVTTTVELKSSMVIAASAIPDAATSADGAIQLSGSGTTSIFNVDTQNTFLIDNDRGTAFNFNGANLITHSYRNSGDNVTSYDSANSRFEVGRSGVSGAVSFGFAINPNLLLGGTLDFTMNVSRSGSLGNLGYVVMLSDGRTSVGVSRHLNTAIGTTAGDITTAVNYGGGASTITVYGAAPGTTSLYIHSVTISAQ